ncbi:ADP-ribosylglycohydrolase family protein [Endozoicomonas sp.]|uniref:ADP-ribosylglycohydrolase family protein n=1 Tax=Endozoicomonas sp. TaxID=1892382 RepID=UPI00383AF03B
MTISTPDNNIKSRIAGAVYGQAIGDALGMPSELWPRERVKSFFGEITDFLDGPAENNAACYFKKGEFTDDTSMALAVADAVIERKGDIDPVLIGQNILAWAYRIDAFNKNILGPTSKVALNAIKEGIPVSELPNNGMTNGAAMRIAPVASMLSTACVDHFIEDVFQLSSATHKSDVALAGAVAVAWSVARAIDGISWEAIKAELPEIAEKAQKRNITTFSASMARRIELGFDLVKNSNGDEDASEKVYHILGTGTGVIESVPAALAMVELAETDPNRCALLCANLGGDTDTIGAMATAICGAIRGVEAFKPYYMDTINERNDLNLDRYVDLLEQLRIQRGE